MSLIEKGNERLNNHKAVFKGLIKRKYYKFGYEDYYYITTSYNKPSFQEYTLTLNEGREEEFLSIELESPLLAEGEKIYLKELDTVVKVKERHRNSEGGYIYITDYIIKVLEDDESKSSKLEALEKQAEHETKEYERKLKANLKKIDDKLAEFNKAKIKKKWYIFWK